MRLEFDPSKPIYQQIIDEFKRAVARGDLSPGDRIPAQRELAQMAGVNPNTVQRAYREMEQLGIVETLRGQGTFIRRDLTALASIREEMAELAVDNFVEEMRGLGFGDWDILGIAARRLGIAPPAANNAKKSQNDEGGTDANASDQH